MGNILLIALASLVLSGCGQKLSGTYVPVQKGLIDQLEFNSDGSIDSTIKIAGDSQTKRGSYKLDGKKVIVTFGADSDVFTIDDKGCLGTVMGKFCKK